LPTNFIVTGLTTGTTYKFRVQARNAYATSDYSAEAIILAAQMPDQPYAPLTQTSGDNVLIKWLPPFAQGSALTGYEVWIQKADGAYQQDFWNCNGSSAEILSAAECEVPISTLTSTFGLPWGSSINAYVVAYNTYGFSQPSPTGNGAVILTSPDMPINLEEIVANRTPTSISIQWEAGASDGGTQVLDYRVSYD
jgi:hypothetical protein